MATLTDGSMTGKVLSLPEAYKLIEDLTTNLSALKTNMEYHAGDVISREIRTVGFITGGGAYVNFLIPLSKPVGNDVSTITTAFTTFTVRQI
ncbi:hypothetical protein [Acidaminococcus massiliensis]|uniref:hypothetical protein n=1 Tax=Acidaminococcus massiliensis TaxID=1852375 RepID=UPI00094EDD6C|nr:hypothetical protein [Acidaminococcus massiliensis]